VSRKLKYGSVSHQILLVRKSADSAGKTLQNIMLITRRKENEIDKALDVLARNGYAARSQYTVRDGGVTVTQPLWAITAKGQRQLTTLSRETPPTRGEKDVIDFEHLKERDERQKERRRLARRARKQEKTNA